MPPRLVEGIPDRARLHPDEQPFDDRVRGVDGLAVAPDRRRPVEEGLHFRSSGWRNERGYATSARASGPATTTCPSAGTNPTGPPTTPSPAPPPPFTSNHPANP